MSQEPAEQKPTGISLFDLTVTAIRTYALYLLLTSMFFAVQTVVFYLSGEWKNFQGSNLYLSSLSFFVWAAAALLLLAKSDAIARFIMAGRENSTNELSIGISELVSAALTVMGVSFLISGLQGLLGEGARWVFAAKDEMTGQRPHIPWTIDLIVGSAVRFIAGLLLIIGFRRITGICRSVRKFFSLKEGAEIENSTAEKSRNEDKADQETKQG
jgi:hypothetical protein